MITVSEEEVDQESDPRFQVCYAFDMSLNPKTRLPLAVLLFSLLIIPATSSSAKASWMPSSTSSKSIVWAVGDSGVGDDSEPTLDLVRSRASRLFFYLGDVYEHGTAEEFLANYGFAPLAHKTAPTIGNHEWDNRFTGYYPFWQNLRGSAPPPYYSFWVSGWQVLVLNSEESLAPGSDQHSWLRDRLRKHPRQKSCRIVISHRPRWSAGSHGDNDSLQGAVDLLNGRARVWLSGHDHNMQYIKKNGIHQFVSGSSGRGVYPVDWEYSGLRFANDDAEGALRLILRRQESGKRGIVWQFWSTNSSKLREGRLTCRRA